MEACKVTSTMNMCQAYLFEFLGRGADGLDIWSAPVLPDCITSSDHSIFSLLQFLDHINTFIGMITFVFRYHPSEVRSERIQDAMA